MTRPRFHLSGLLAVLLALMAQLGAGATVPRLDPLTTLAGAEALCHGDDDSGGRPDQGPAHSPDCLVCPLCAIAHASATPLVPVAPGLLKPRLAATRRMELPPPSTAPPAPYRSPGQPRAPPAYS